MFSNTFNFDFTFGTGSAVCYSQEHITSLTVKELLVYVLNSSGFLQGVLP